MRKRVVLPLRWLLPMLAFGLLASGMAACGGSQPTGAESTPALNPPPTGTPLPPAAVAVSFGATSEPGDSAQRTANPAAPTEIPADVIASADGVAITPEQMVAALEEVLNGIYENALPSVVYIRVGNPELRAFRGNPSIPEELLWGAGSGFVWDTEGHIVSTITSSKRPAECRMR